MWFDFDTSLSEVIVLAKSAKSKKVKKKEVSEKVEKEVLPFPNSVVVRHMREHLDPGKQIKKRVKIEMNKWLGDMLAKVTEEMNKLPYRYVDYAMFKDAVAKYTKLEEIAEERERLLKYIDKLKSDCEFMEKEIKRKYQVEEEFES
ncbi:MAG: hypothetical protein J7L44_01990 [Candidatus Diapherotrites archaeon]|nr:hypothetical protein [Candidatus Diapherotrites archaeon]